MNLFEKIDWFEKMATQLDGSYADDSSETIDNYDESELFNKESITARTDLLNLLLKF